MAYFRGSRMLGKTKPLQIGTFMAIKGINPAGYHVYVMLEGTKHLVMIRTTHRNTKWKAVIKDGKPHFSIKIVLEVNVEEKPDNNFHINNADIVRQIQETEERKGEKFCAKLIKQTQSAGSDIFGFGEYIRAKKPGYWNAKIRTKERWQEAYKEMTFEIQLSVNVRRVGMKAS